jgi:hypothetical protein
MKVILYFLFLPFTAFCQISSDDTLNIDPRQYIKIYETDNTKKKILLWSWNDTVLINQKRKIVDAFSTIQIEFDKKGISRNEFFKGNITIEGQIVSAKGGKDPVEVLPYSRIGEEKKTVGLTSRPPTEISTIFINLLEKSMKITLTLEKEKNKRSQFINLVTDLTSIRQDIENTSENVLLSNSKEVMQLYSSVKILYELDYDFSKIPSNLLGNPRYQMVDPSPEKIDKNGVLVSLNNLIVEIKDANKKGRFLNEKTLFEKISDLNEDIKIIIQYINYFKSSGEQAEDAFLSFIQLDYIALDIIEEKLKVTNTEFDLFVNKKGNNDKKEDEIIQESFNLLRLYDEAIQEINKIARIESTIIGIYLNQESTKIERGPVSYAPVSFNSEMSLYDKLLAKKEPLITYIAHEASKIIYLNLDYATIDLLKERASEGDYLYLFAVLEETERRTGGDAKAHQKVLPIGRYELRNTGWVTKISDSFVLAHRINEPDPSLNPNVSPSNFKGAPGASLLLTRRKNGNQKDKILNALQPSFGVDVSYIDFNRNDDVEVGVGLVLGFFDNKMFCVGGLNLNSTGSNEVSPYYFGLGFSFANIAGKLIKN